MENITLRPLFHNRQERVTLVYANLPFVNKVVCQLPGARWIQTYKCWYIPLNETVCREAIKRLKEHGDPDVELLRIYLEKQKSIAAIQVKEKNPVLTQAQVKVYNKISESNLVELGRMADTLKPKAYSLKTLITCRTETMQLLRVIGNKRVDNKKGSVFL